MSVTGTGALFNDARLHTCSTANLYRDLDFSDHVPLGIFTRMYRFNVNVACFYILFYVEFDFKWFAALRILLAIKSFHWFFFTCPCAAIFTTSEALPCQKECRLHSCSDLFRIRVNSNWIETLKYLQRPDTPVTFLFGCPNYVSIPKKIKIQLIHE